MTADGYTVVLGDRVKKFRVARGLSQRALAKVLGVSNGHLCKIEHGKVDPTYRILRAIRDTFGCSYDLLLSCGDKGEVFPPLPHEYMTIDSRVTRLENEIARHRIDHMVFGRAAEGAS